MSERDRWNNKYSRGEHTSEDPSPSVSRLSKWFPPSKGRALDLAGGAGRHAIWLARQGWQVTLADISDVALELAVHRATAAGLNVTPLAIDLERELPAEGCWDLVLCVHFLHRPLLAALPKLLATGGVAVVVHPTLSNLARHPQPSARFLLEDGELIRLNPDLPLLHSEEGWTVENRHEAVLVVGGK